MPVTVEGSEWFDISAANAATVSLTVPAGTELIVCHWEFLRNNNQGMTSLLYGSGNDAMTFAVERVTDGNYNGVGIATIVPGATGTQDLDYDIDGPTAPSEGGHLLLHYLSGVNTTVVDSGANSQTGTTAVSVSLTVSVGDFISGTCGEYQDGSDTARVSETVTYDQQDKNAGSHVNSLFRLDEADATTEAFNYDGEDWSWITAIAFSPSGGGPVATPKNLTLLGVG